MKAMISFHTDYNHCLVHNVEDSMTQQEKEENKILIAGIKDRLKREAVWSRPAIAMGGQQVGIPRLPDILTSEELGFSIMIGYGRSSVANKAMCMTLFELYIDEIIK